MSDGVLFGNEEVAQVARIRETTCIFFNSCETSKCAAYAVRHGVRFAVHTNILLPDQDAWKAAVAFYESLQNGHGKDFVGAYVVADSGDGDYGLSVASDYIVELQRNAALAASIPHTALPLSRREALLWGLGLLGATGALTTAINWWAGRF